MLWSGRSSDCSGRVFDQVGPSVLDVPSGSLGDDASLFTMASTDALKGFVTVTGTTIVKAVGRRIPVLSHGRLSFDSKFLGLENQNSGVQVPNCLPQPRKAADAVPGPRRPELRFVGSQHPGLADTVHVSPDTTAGRELSESSRGFLRAQTANNRIGAREAAGHGQESQGITFENGREADIPSEGL